MSIPKPIVRNPLIALFNDEACTSRVTAEIFLGVPDTEGTTPTVTIWLRNMGDVTLSDITVSPHNRVRLSEQNKAFWGSGESLMLGSLLLDEKVAFRAYGSFPNSATEDVSTVIRISALY